MNKLLTTYFNTIKRFLPEKQRSTSVGLDIGSAECKFVELGINSDKALEIIRWGIHPIIKNDTSAAIKALLEKLGPGKRSFYCSVFGRGSLIRYIDMPQMSLEELRSAFTYESDKYFPFAPDEIYKDCLIIKEHKNKQKTMYVMAAAAKKKQVEERLKLLNDHGISVDFIGINPIAVANIIHCLGKDEDKLLDSAVGFLDMGESVSSLSIFVGGVPWFTRDIFVGGQDLTRKISNSLSVDMDVAEALKCNPGDKLEEVLNASENAVMNIVKELQMSFDYFMTEKKMEVNKLLLTGGASRMQGLVGVFEKNLGVKVQLWDPISYVKLSESIATSNIKEKSLGLGVALGLALYDFEF